MAELRSVCVYCGSAPGNDPAYNLAAEELGLRLAEAGIRLVYGGGSIGLMGTVARAAMAAGGEVTGIIPRFLKDREIMLREVADLIVTEDMHERKRIMFERSDAFVVLPGGIGTLEEAVEMLTWAQLGRHAKPILLVNLGGFWDPLCQLFQHMEDAGFIHKPFLDNGGGTLPYLVVDDIETVIPSIRDVLSAVPREELETQGGASRM